MGCTQSKIENEEAVSRCKDRKLFMKDAVTARNAFSAAHSAYTTSLKNTGAAMSDYAQGEVQNPQNVVHSQSLPASLSAAPQPPLDPLLPPPPPPALSTFQTPIQRAASMPEIKMPKREMDSGVGPIMEEESDDEDDMESHEKLVTRKKSSNSNRPKSEDQKQSAGPTSPERPPPSAVDTQSHTYGWDYFFPAVENIPATTLEEVKMDKVQTETERKVVDEIPKREEEDVPEKLVARHDGHEQPPPPPPPSVMEEEKVMPPPGPGIGGGSVGRNSKKGNNAVGVSGGVAGEKKVEKRNVNLLQIFTDLDDHFLKASESAQEVSKMLEATRLHYHSNFADNRGHIDHSATVLRVITWNRSFRMPNVDVVKDDFDTEENETHATVLDKLLAWEKKLYDEVKAGELMKFDYQRKVAMLNKAKKRGTNSDALEKIKATVSHLHTRYIVDMQSLDSTVMEINRLRDEQLYPKLVQLVDGMADMWETMQEHHESQLKIVSALRYVGLSQCPKETTDHHHQRTIQLWAVVREWHTQFCKLIDHQKEYVKALNNWLRLNLIPIESNLKEKVSSPPRVHTPPIQRLLFHWHDYLGKLPDDVARSAIFKFAAVVETIMQHQEEEIKLKLRCEETRKELSRKTRMFEDWYHKYMQKRTPEELETDVSMVKDAVAERQFQVEVVRKRLEEEEEAYQKQCIQVREKSLASLKNHLPELFRAMCDTAFASLRMYGDLRNISQRRDQSESVS